jgi:hypothetical protein
VYLFIYIYTCIYIYTGSGSRERERERERNEREGDRDGKKREGGVERDRSCEGDSTSGPDLGQLALRNLNGFCFRYLVQGGQVLCHRPLCVEPIIQSLDGPIEVQRHGRGREIKKDFLKGRGTL